MMTSRWYKTSFVSLFFRFTLPLEESHVEGPPGSKSKPVACIEPSTVEHYAEGLMQAFRDE